MATLPTQSATTILANFSAGVQGRATKLIDFAVGAVLRAIGEAATGVALWLQSLALQVSLLTRLATSYGNDVDTFVGDWGIVTRLGATFATGSVTFARFTAGPTAPFIPNGTLIQSGDGTQQFNVVADPTNGAYSAALLGYTMAASTGSLTVAAQSITPGTGGNVGIGVISLIASPLTGIDTVTNAAPFAGGTAAESDTSLKARFQQAILGLSAGDLYGTTAAINATNIAVQFTITEDYTYSNLYAPGTYFIVADDGSGAPSATFLTAIGVAVQSVRPLGIQATVFAPTITTAGVSMTIVTAAGFNHAVVVAQVAALLTTNINMRGLGNGLPFYDLAVWALSVPGVINVGSILLNGGTADIPTQVPGVGWQAAKLTTVKAGAIVVS